MTVNVTELRERLQAHVDAVQVLMDEGSTDEQGFGRDLDYLNGRKTAFEKALEIVGELENEAATERDEAFGEGVNLAAVARLEAFSRGEALDFNLDAERAFPHERYGDYATETGALDQASGTVYSDADGGL